MAFDLNVSIRKVQGSSASRRLRREGKVPGIVYGAGKPATMIEMSHKDIYFSLKKEAFHSAVINLNIDGNKEQALLRDYQVHAYKPKVHHVDFQRIDPTHELHTKVPLHFVNAEVSPGIKVKGGILNQLATEVEVKCLAKDLPEFIQVDLANLDIGQAIHLQDLKLPAGVKAFTHTDENIALVNIVAPSGASVAEETAEVATETKE